MRCRGVGTQRSFGSEYDSVVKSIRALRPSPRATQNLNDGQLEEFLPWLLYLEGHFRGTKK